MNENKPVQGKYAWGDHHQTGIAVVRACLQRRRSELVLELVGPFMEVACTSEFVWLLSLFVRSFALSSDSLNERVAAKSRCCQQHQQE